jgi:hypothetical protein
MKQVLLAAAGLAALVALAGIPKNDAVTAAAQASSTSCVTIDQVNWQHADAPGTLSYKMNYYTVVGQVTNKCSHPIGVKLSAVFRDSNGQVLNKQDNWIAGSANIPQNKPFAFQFYAQVIDPASMTAEVSETMTW